MKPITLSKFVVGISVALVASALAAGEITLFEREGFQGRRLTIRETMWNLDRTDFNDRAESIIVRDGVWEVCSDARFSGQCTRLRPGEYFQGRADPSPPELGEPAVAVASVIDVPFPSSGGGLLAAGTSLRAASAGLRRWRRWRRRSAARHFVFRARPERACVRDRPQCRSKSRRHRF